MKFNFKVVRGDTVPMTVVVTVDDVAFDLTNCTLFFTAKEDPSQSDDDALIRKHTGAGITHTNAAAGQARIVLAAADTASLPIDTELFCDVQVKTPTDEIYTVATGTITFRSDVTRRTTTS